MFEFPGKPSLQLSQPIYPPTPRNSACEDAGPAVIQLNHVKHVSMVHHIP